MLKSLTASLSAVLLASTLVGASPRVVLEDAFGGLRLDKDVRSQKAVSGKLTYASINGGQLFSRAKDGLAVNGSWAQAFVPFDPVALAKPGDALTLTLGIRHDAAPGDVPGALRIGLYDTGGNPATLYPFNRFNNPDGGKARGYFFTLNTGAEGGSNLYREPGDRRDGKQVVFNTTAGNRIVGFTGAVFGTEERTVSLTIERTAKGLIVHGSIAGNPFVINREALIGDPVTTAFDAVALGSGNAPAGYVVTRIQVSATTR